MGSIGSDLGRSAMGSVMLPLKPLAAVSSIVRNSLAFAIQFLLALLLVVQGAAQAQNPDMVRPNFSSFSTISLSFSLSAPSGSAFSFSAIAPPL